MTPSPEPPSQDDLLNEAYLLALDRFNDHNFNESISLCQEILRLNPNHLPGLNLLGLISLKLDRLQLAESFFQKALSKEHENIDIWVNLGEVYKRMGEFPKALSALKSATGINPEFPPALNNLGNLYLHAGEYKNATSIFTRLLKIDPTNIDGNYNYGILQGIRGKYHLAIESYKKVLDLQTDHKGALLNISNAFLSLGLLDDALKAYHHISSLFPEDSTSVSNSLVAENYLSTLTDHDIFEKHVSFGQRMPSVKRKTIHESNKKIPFKVGYISPDFRFHPIYFFFSAILKYHSKAYFETFCYSDVLRSDEATLHLQDTAHNWRDISNLNDQDVITQIQSDEIDLLIDLSGHTARNRLAVMAQKPAPIQATYLGYPNTTGLRSIDFCITDAIITPDRKSQRFYTEKICTLPGPFFTYTPPMNTPTITTLPVIKNGHITFGVFHNLAKVSNRIIKRWCQLLQQLPDAHLLWQAKAFAEGKCCNQILDFFSDQAISPERIHLFEASPLLEHLDLHNTTDISLDTAPWTGHTTTCHSLWMGVPIITLAGESHRSRLGMTTLQHAGLSELITRSPEEYLSKNIELANDIPRLKKYRTTLRSTLKNSQIMNYESFLINLEQKYLKWIYDEK